MNRSMNRVFLGLSLSLISTASLAASNAPCAEYDQLRAQRDQALGQKNLTRYCEALSGLIRLMPAKPPEQARLQCEAKATNMKVDVWLGIRPDVLSTMKSTFDQQCK